MTSLSFIRERDPVDGAALPFVQVRMEHEFGQHTAMTVRMNLSPQAVQGKSLARIQRELCEAAIGELQKLAQIHLASEQEEESAQTAARSPTSS
jgi:hypothetical protein